MAQGGIANIEKFPRFHNVLKNDMLQVHQNASLCGKG